MTNKITRKKEFGLYKMVATINAIATREGEITDPVIIKDEILKTRDKLRREMIVQRMYIDSITDPDEMEKIPVNKELVIYLNPYYEYELIRNLKQFPVDATNPDAMEWIKNIETYLAMNLLYFKDFDKVMESVKDFDGKYTQREVLEAREIVIDYYDLENPVSLSVTNEGPLLYYQPRKELVERAREDVASYELSLLAKGLLDSDTFEELVINAGFSRVKIVELLESMAKAKQGDFTKKSIAILKTINKDEIKEEIIEDIEEELTEIPLSEMIDDVLELEDNKEKE